MKPKNFDKKFDKGKDITKHLDVSKRYRPEQEQKRVNVDFPQWMIHKLDKEAKRLGVPRQSIIKKYLDLHKDSTVKAHSKNAPSSDNFIFQNLTELLPGQVSLCPSNIFHDWF